ncbi:MAG TPA: hypothetical protein VKP67_25225 [Xanthobacteraceae bacterium]|nr:hypothetical protein [Xanthobacteraceae bacterium]
MFIIPGFLIAIVTFPGVIAHEVGHRFFCDLADVPVYEVCYFRIGNPSGYVIHVPATSLRASFLVTIGPLIVNSVLCAVICFAPIIALNLDVADLPGVFLLLLWLGISIGMHAFPSPQDAENFSRAVRASGRRGLLYLVAKAFQFLVRLANALRFLWFDLFYAAIIASLTPVLITHATTG